MTIRKMTAADVAAAAEIESTVLDGWSTDGIAAALHFEASRCFVAEENGEIAAFCAFTLVCGEANLDAVSVAKKFRRRGIAKTLLNAAFDILHADKIFLEVRSQNAPALALYEALGFVRIGTRPHFYQNPADSAVLMQKTF